MEGTLASTKASSPEQSNGSNWRSQAGKAVLRGAGAVVVGVAAQTALKRAQRPKVLGVPLPRVKTKKVGKNVVNMAGRVERISEDVRVASSQAKRIGEKLT
jgi:hypothetical protein